jgi:hypothetical protein
MPPKARNPSMTLHPEAVFSGCPEISQEELPLDSIEQYLSLVKKLAWGQSFADAYAAANW